MTNKFSFRVVIPVKEDVKETETEIKNFEMEKVPPGSFWNWKRSKSGNYEISAKSANDDEPTMKAATMQVKNFRISLN